MKTKDFKIEIMNCNLSLHYKELNLWNFITFSTNSYLITLISLEKEEIKKEINKHDPNTISDFIKAKEALKISDKNRNDYLNELAFKMYYQAFEEYLLEIISILFYHYPVF
jgi:hypothetical protein